MGQNREVRWISKLVGRDASAQGVDQLWSTLDPLHTDACVQAHAHMWTRWRALTLLLTPLRFKALHQRPLVPAVKISRSTSI